MHAYLRIALLSLALPLTAQAQTSQAPVEVEADRLDLDQRAGTAVYSGNVNIRQGEMQIRGDRVEITRNDAGELSQATATGERAYLRNQLENEPAPMEGWARRIVYHVSERRVELIDQAELTQRSDRFRGGRLEYFIDREVVQARSDVSGGDNQRIRMTLQPAQ
ncbi:MULTISPECIES: lipopolysaccharide transport periplasmic protein LptA [unclassified Halomonas]|uniref:lipopolysaccharide transport periplasmic protein LptA n=1 Tax=unclassified Halomonas TaxID=2609666 RepID=UPI0021E452B4|nr:MULTISPECIES: lipopolysaccharide transport periplasmic protein LptA [unclassified Halomonas]UYF98556.1 lipopolysaccharide transport periplasmic protein LptA [Halomonas sp. GD1P12]WNL40330.1 lipopolysaccharide transport periplasmic protein LptA [Halomonas sp. PAMB 3232]WNL43661.1 lipopolysaccharide transport periplasmic protein LptA [Halomonas sp. PAMB 3264]